MTLMLVPSISWSMWLVMWALTLLAFWTMRHEIRDLMQERPTAVRFGGAILFACLGGVSLFASEIYLPCDWDTLINHCGGNEACAWAIWWWNACAFRPS